VRASIGSDAQTAGPPPFENMRWIPAGEFRMGSEDFYPKSGPYIASLWTASGWTSGR
jgi:hypothetical protein